MLHENEWKIRSYGPASIAADGNRVEGMAIVYSRPSVVMDLPGVGKFREVIHPGAAQNALAMNPDIPICYGHEINNILGRTGTGTLILTETADGVAFSLLLPPTTMGRDVREMIRRGDIKGASFYLQASRDSWSKMADGTRLHEVHQLATMKEISLTPYPAYPDALAALRSYHHHFIDDNKMMPLATRQRQVQLAAATTM